MSLDILKKIETGLRVYAALALGAAAVLSLPLLAWAPVIVLGWFIFQWKRPLTAPVSLVTDYFLFFALSLFFSESVGPIPAWLISLPVLVLVDRRLHQAPGYLRPEETERTWRLTTPAAVLLVVLAGAWILAGAMGSTVLLLACGTLTVYAGLIAFYIFRTLSLKPVRVEKLFRRVVAGKEYKSEVHLEIISGRGGCLFLEPLDARTRICPEVLPLDKDEFKLDLRFTPELAGPTTVWLRGYILDRRGLVQIKFEICPLELVVIPRARYAEWIVSRYLAGTQAGALPLISNVGKVTSLHGLRRGVEYYGNREYLPGDSLRNIDWKHTYKSQELIVKDYNEHAGQTAIMLVNLTARDTEEADKLAYNILALALSLAREQIPAAMAAYNQKEVVLTTVTLAPTDLVARALQIFKQIDITQEPERYLSPPDVRRLKANISRLQAAESESGRILRRLLQMEYRNLETFSREHPLTLALIEALVKTGKQSAVVVLSQKNHDAEALVINTDRLEQRGIRVVYI